MRAFGRYRRSPRAAGSAPHPGWGRGRKRPKGPNCATSGPAATTRWATGAVC